MAWGVIPLLLRIYHSVSASPCLFCVLSSTSHHQSHCIMAHPCAQATRGCGEVHSHPIPPPPPPPCRFSSPSCSSTPFPSSIALHAGLLAPTSGPLHLLFPLPGTAPAPPPASLSLGSLPTSFTSSLLHMLRKASLSALPPYDYNSLPAPVM